MLDRGGWFGELHKKRRALDRLLPTIRATVDPLLRDLYIARAAEKTGIAKEVLLREFAGGAVGMDGGVSTVGSLRDSEATGSSSGVHPHGPTVRSRQSPTGRRTNHTHRGIAAERELTRAMLADPLRVEPIAEKVGPDRFRDPHYRAIFSAMLTLGDAYTPEQLADQLPFDTIDIVNDLLSEPDLQVDPDKTVDASVSAIEMRDLDDRLAEIDTLTALADDTQKDELMAEKRRLLKEIELSGQPMARGFKFLKTRRSRTRE